MLKRATFRRPLRTPTRALWSRPRVVKVQNKQYVPSESFGGRSPERAASDQLRRLFTFIAARIVLSQLEGSGRGAVAAYNKESYDDIVHFLLNEKMQDADEWLEKLTKKNRGLGLRLMEVRFAYAKEDFEWENLKALSVKELNEGSIKIMRKSAAASLKALSDQTTPDGQGSSEDQKSDS